MFGYTADKADAKRAVTMLPLLHTAAFADAFLDKPPMRAVLDRIPVHVITNPEAGLLGAAAAGNRHLR